MCGQKCGDLAGYAVEPRGGVRTTNTRVAEATRPAVVAGRKLRVSRCTSSDMAARDDIGWLHSGARRRDSFLAPLAE